MAFGGYKFYGVHRGTPASGSELVDTHCARVVAFLKANEAASSHWAIDPAHSGIYLVDENEYITIDGTDYHCIDSIRDDNANIIGNITYFKYSHEGLVGYYLILTVSSVYMLFRSGTATTSGFINFYFDQMCCPEGINYPKALQGFCLHALSLEPFGSLPSLGQPSSDLIPNKSTRLTPVGSCNIPNSGVQSYAAESTNSFIYTSNAYFGYAIKGADIISLAATNPTYPSINVLSLDAFDKYFNSGDSNGLLMFPVSSRSNSVNEITDSIKSYCGYSGQFLNENGTAICCNSGLYTTSTGQQAVIEYSGMSLFNKDNVGTKVSVVGCSVGLLNNAPTTMQSGLLGKGITRPEFLSLRISTPADSNTAHSIGETFNDGKQMICFYNYSNSIYRLCFNGNNVYTATSVVLLCGWDTTNPDIRQASSWGVFDNSWVIEI